MGKETRNYSNVSTVIQNAIDAFNTIEQTLSTMGAKTTTNGTISSTANYLSAADLNSIIANQLQLKPTTQKSITAESGSLVDSSGKTIYNSYTVQTATIGTVTTAVSQTSMISAGTLDTNGTTNYYPMTISDITVAVPASRSGWYTGGNHTSSALTFNLEAAKFTFNPSSGTVTCTSPGYVKETASGGSVATMQTAQLTVNSAIASLTGDVFEATNPSTTTNYYAVTATPSHSLSGFRAGVLTSTSGVTNGTDAETTRYIKKSSVSGGTTSSNTTTIKPGQTATIAAGYAPADRTVVVSTSDANITANKVLNTYKGYGANNTLITGNIPVYNSSTTVNLNGFMTQSGNTVTVSGTINTNPFPTGYYSGAKFSGTITLSPATLTVNAPTYLVYAGDSTVDNVVLDEAPTGNYYRVDISPTATTTAGYIDAITSGLAQPKSVYITKKEPSNISVTGGVLSKGSGYATINSGYDSAVFKTDGSGDYAITVTGSGKVSMNNVMENHPAGYYTAPESARLVIQGGELQSNTATATIKVPAGSAGSLGLTLNSHSMSAEAGDFSGSAQTSSHETLTLNQLGDTPPSGVYYKLKSELTITPTISGTTAGFIKTFPSGSQSTYTKYYYIPQATFEYTHDSTSGADFIQCKTAGYYPTGILNIVDTENDSTDDIDYADVIATLSNETVLLTGTPGDNDYEITISKDADTNPGYVSGSNGTLSLKSRYYVKRGSVSSSVKTLTSSISANNSMTLHDSSSGLKTGYYTLTPSATAETQMSLTPGYIPSKGTEGSTTANGTVKYVNAGTVSVTGGEKTAGSGIAAFEATTIQRDTNNILAGTDVLQSSKPESGTYYEINISGKGSVSVGDVNYSLTEGYIKALSTSVISGGSYSSNTATNKKYVYVSTLTNALASITNGYTATDVQYGEYLKISQGYYPFDRWIRATSNVAAVSPRVSSITATQIGPSGSAYTFTTTLSGNLNVDVTTNGYITSSNGAITPKNISEFSAKTVDIYVGKGSVLGGGVYLPNNTTSTVSADKGYAKLINTPSSNATGYVKVTAVRAATTVDEGYVKTQDISLDSGSVTAYISAVSAPSITTTSSNVYGSDTIGGISEFNSSTGALVAPGAQSGTFSVSGSISGTASYKDKYMLDNITATGTATGTASATLNSNATGSSVDSALSQLYKCILGTDYNTATAGSDSGTSGSTPDSGNDVPSILAAYY